ncbi:MAG: hypothetical protein LJE83_13755 [Gammaproteobacteria bacterium]|nr:hypothetical protein [Gammaproteobacteria bacterium]
MSSIADSISVMLAVPAMNPEMSAGQWLLIEITAGVVGSQLSIGFVARAAVMGQVCGNYIIVYI